MTKIPEYPRFAGVELEHRDEVRAALAAMERPIAEWSFTNLYLFREPHGYRLSRWGGLVLIAGAGYDGVAYGFPPWGEGEAAEGVERLFAHLAESGGAPLLFPVPEQLVAAHFAGPEWTAQADRDQADYIYLREELAELPGKKFHKRRNRLAKFLRETPGEVRYAPLDDGHAEACVRIAEGWCEERCSLERPSTYQETAAAVEALRRRGELELSGGVILEDGQVAAYCLGEPLDAETFVVHFEKAIPGREGLAQVINRDFCKNGLGGYRFVNREQDLGDEGLRQAKLQYHPVRLAEKFRVRPAGENA